MNEKINVQIDAIICEAELGENLLVVALRNGIQIPNLCFHAKISPTAACRLCVVKLDGKITTSCSTKVEKGMKVIAFDEELEEIRCKILDHLVAEHNEEINGSYTDEFKNIVTKYKLDLISNRTIPSFSNLLPHKLDASSPVLTYDSSKCIKCFRCIKACGEVQGKNVLSMDERGIASYVVAGFGKWNESECDGCGECVQLCPTGALVEKPFYNILKINKIEKRVKTTCPYCGVGCQMELLVQEGKIMRVLGVDDVLPNNGKLCIKGRFGYNFVSRNDRLKVPLIKKDGVFVESSWDEALALIASKFSEIRDNYGPNSIAGYASAKCTNEDNYIFQRFMRTVIGTNNIDNCARLCHSSTVTAMMRSIGDGAGTNSIEDYSSADCIYITGNNVVETHPVTATYIKQGRMNGAKIIVVDPKFTTMVNYADVWLQPKIGTDVALLNALIHVIIKEGLVDTKFIESRVEGGLESFQKLKELTNEYTPILVQEITGVPSEKIELAARIYGNSKRALICTGMGMSQEITGTNNVFSLINMCLITGNIGKPGAGINPPRGQNNVQGVSDVGCLFNLYPGYFPVSHEEQRLHLSKIWKVDVEKIPNMPGLSAVEIMKAAHQGAIKCMYIMGENPLLSDPNLNHVIDAVKNLEFLVLQDIFMNETTAYADVILPAASFAEKDGTFTNSDRRVNRVRSAIDAPGQAKKDWVIIHQIASKMGSPMPDYLNESSIFDEMALVMPIYAGINWQRIDKEGIQWPCTSLADIGTKTLFLEKFNTPSGRAKLNPIHFVPQTENASEEFPFILNTGRILYQYHTSTMSGKSLELNSFASKSYVLMNEQDSMRLGFANGDKVKIIGMRGELETVLKVSDEVSIGELFMPFHFAEAKVNMLTRDELDPNSKIPPYKLSAVKVILSE